MSDFRMPSLGADMDEGTVLEWHVSPGQAFAKGDVLLDVDTDKAAFEVEADAAGVLEEILVPEGTTVAVGTLLARLQGDGPSAAAHADVAVADAAAGDAAAAEVVQPVAARHATGPRAEHGSRRRVSPRARKRARELGVDIAALGRGSGPDGAVNTRDIEAAAALGGQPQGERPRSREERLRGVIAAMMSRSKREIPHYYLEQTIDLEPALAWLERENGGRSIRERLLPNVLLIKAMAQALRQVPELNAYWEREAAQLQPSVNVGVAIALRGGGVIAPAVHDADGKTLDALMIELNDLVKRARGGTLRHREMTEGTITVTSLGDRGVDKVYGVIFPPQVALIGFGAISARPWVVDGAVVPRRIVTATLSADHRASDGHRGGLLLRAIAELLESPETL